MHFQPPPQLLDAAESQKILQQYYSGWKSDTYAYTGSKFDTWPNNDPLRFSADDLAAVSFLSVSVPPRAARRLLVEHAPEFDAMLRALPTDLELHMVDEIPSGWWDLYQALVDLDGVGPTIASKLLARKRPAFRPVYDSVVSTYLSNRHRQWEPIRSWLTQDDRAADLLDDLATRTSGIPPISKLRALDVICWMLAKSPAEP